MSLISDQISAEEIQAITRELRAVIKNGVRGDVVEFGCYLGTTSIHIAKALAMHDLHEFYVYDSFEGLPDKSNNDASPLGIQFKSGELTASKKQFINNMRQAGVKLPYIKKAWFNELAQSDIPEQIAFAFLDGDFYDSIKQSLKLIENNMAKRSVIVVHDYSNQALPGSAIATNEWLKNREYKIKFEQSLAIIYLP